MKMVWERPMKELCGDTQLSNPFSRKKKILRRIKRSHSSVESISTSGLAHIDYGLVGAITIYITCGCSTDFDVKNKYIFLIICPKSASSEHCGYSHLKGNSPKWSNFLALAFHRAFINFVLYERKKLMILTRHDAQNNI